LEIEYQIELPSLTKRLNKPTYQVLLTEEEGTLFWHAHSDWSRATIHGALVILPTEGTTYPFPMPDAEQILLFGT
jgi:laccase